MIPLSLFTFLTLCVSQLFTKKLRYLQIPETFSCTFTSLPFELKQMSHLLNVVCQSTIESFDYENLIIEIVAGGVIYILLCIIYWHKNSNSMFHTLIKKFIQKK